MLTRGAVAVAVILALSVVAVGQSDAAKPDAVSDTATVPQKVAADPAPAIAPYLGSRKGAVSLTFDDGFRKEVEDAAEILDACGLKGTFFLIPIRMADPKGSAMTVTWKRAKELMAEGHEMGTHGAIAPKLHEADAETLDQLVNGSWQLIKENTGVAPVSYALPGGSRADKRVMAIISEHHYFIRKPTLLPGASIMGYGNAGKRKWSDEQTRKAILATRDAGGWHIAVIHSIVGGYAPFASKDEFRGHCQWLKSQEDTIWVAPMGVIGRYVKARQAATLKVIEQKADSVRFTVSSDLKPAEVFQVPLTIVIPAAGATKAVATQGDRPAPKVTIKDGNILVDVLPDGTETTVTWTK